MVWFLQKNNEIYQLGILTCILLHAEISSKDQQSDNHPYQLPLQIFHFLSNNNHCHKIICQQFNLIGLFTKILGTAIQKVSMRLKVKFLVIAQHNLLEVFIYINLTPLIYYEQCTHTFVIFVVIKTKLFGKLTKVWQTVVQKENWTQVPRNH